MPSVELELAKRTVEAALPMVGERGVLFIGEMLTTCCVKCDVRNECEFAYDVYNRGCEPKIDCLASK